MTTPPPCRLHGLHSISHMIFPLTFGSACWKLPTFCPGIWRWGCCHYQGHPRGCFLSLCLAHRGRGRWQWEHSANMNINSTWLNGVVSWHDYSAELFTVITQCDLMARPLGVTIPFGHTVCHSESTQWHIFISPKLLPLLFFTKYF